MGLAGWLAVVCVMMPCSPAIGVAVVRGAAAVECACLGGTRHDLSRARRDRAGSKGRGGPGLFKYMCSSVVFISVRSVLAVAAAAGAHAGLRQFCSFIEALGEEQQQQQQQHCCILCCSACV